MNFRPAPLWAPSPSVNMNISEAEVRQILAMTPAGQKVLQESLKDMYDKIHDDAMNAAAKTWNDRLDQAEDYVGVLGLISHVRALELEATARKDPDYEAEYQRKKDDGTWETVRYKPAGWRKTHFSIPEIVGVIAGRQSDACDEMGGASTKLKGHYDAFLEKYGVPIVCDSYDINQELDLEQFNLDRENPFEGMTGWQVYEEGVKIGNQSACLLSTVTDCLVLEEHSTMRKLIDWFTRKKNEKLKSFKDPSEIESAVDHARKKGLTIPVGWQKSLDTFIKYEAMKNPGGVCE